ncbi:MAG: RNA polymerase sigma factor [Elusimicrobia bacterium]|nr:RNA polymerase sigma factor [Elusimicrobiota bacterium]
MNQSDEELMMEIAKGDKKSFNELFLKYKEQLFNFIYRQVGNSQLAEDLTQNVFISVFKKAGTFNTDKPFKPWLYKIAVNACYYEYRQQKRNIVLSLDNEIENSNGETVELKEMQSDDDRGPQEEVEKKDEQDKIRKILNSLNENHRLIINMFVYEGISYKEMASLMDCPIGTIKSRIYYALREIKEQIEKQGGGINGMQ